MKQLTPISRSNEQLHWHQTAQYVRRRQINEYKAVQPVLNTCTAWT